VDAPQLQVEEMMRDITNADPEWRTIVLRYFNPVGAHPSGRLGEDPQGFPNNLMPFVQQVAVGRRKELTVFGSDYNTKDGTGVSIVWSLALHGFSSMFVSAFFASLPPGTFIVLGSGRHVLSFG